MMWVCLEGGGWVKLGVSREGGGRGRESEGLLSCVVKKE